MLNVPFLLHRLTRQVRDGIDFVIGRSSALDKPKAFADLCELKGCLSKFAAVLPEPTNSGPTYYATSKPMQKSTWKTFEDGWNHMAVLVDNALKEGLTPRALRESHDADGNLLLSSHSRANQISAYEEQCIDNVADMVALLLARKADFETAGWGQHAGNGQGQGVVYHSFDVFSTSSLNVCVLIT
jgi:hypothetical protein